MIFNAETELAKANARIVDLEKLVDTLLSKLDAAHREVSLLRADNVALKAKIEDLTTINKKLSDENAQMKKRLKIDSSNSLNYSYFDGHISNFSEIAAKIALKNPLFLIFFAYFFVSRKKVSCRGQPPH